MSTRDIAWTSASSSFGSYTIVFTASNSSRTVLACSEKTSAVSSSYLLAYVSSVVRSSIIRRPVWPSPAVMRILREDLVVVCDFCALPDLDSPLLVRLGAIAGCVFGGDTLGDRWKEAKRGGWGRRTEGGGLYGTRCGSMTKRSLS